tara:strand:- start:249 stop:581 length:333 start_codon:yes stop_codon:yes gene_type:complete
MDENIKNIITNEINNNEVCLFMKGTPDVPQCGFSMAVSNILKILEIKFKGINVLDDNNLREGIKKFSDWPTIPQLYLKGEFVGGCDIIKEMYENGQLKEILKKKNISFKE